MKYLDTVVKVPTLPTLPKAMSANHNGRDQFCRAEEGEMMSRPYRNWWTKIVLTHQGGVPAPEPIREECRAEWTLRAWEVVGYVEAVGGNPWELYEIR